jgi:hypothetical protein
MECPLCNGEGCTECEHGIVTITGCPQQYCRSVVKVAQLSTYSEKGLLPIAGGVLDQSAWVMEAISVLQHDEMEFRTR